VMGPGVRPRFTAGPFPEFDVDAGRALLWTLLGRVCMTTCQSSIRVVSWRDSRVEMVESQLAAFVRSWFDMMPNGRYRQQDWLAHELRRLSDRVVRSRRGKKPCEMERGMHKQPLAVCCV
jgi:hypothetical protein